MTQAMDDRQVRLDRMRYIKNTSSSRLCYLAILLDVLYFISIVYNLLFMLMAFLASEGVKSYQASFSWLLYGLGILQAARIFILPLQARAATVVVGGTETAVMENAQFIRVVIYLAGSAVCLVAAAVINQRKCRALGSHLASLETGKEAA